MEYKAQPWILTGESIYLPAYKCISLGHSQDLVKVSLNPPR